MTTSNYPACEDRVLTSEGGYTNNPSDPGGPTNWGITIRDARRYWKPDATVEDVRAMPRQVARDIYRKKYWNVLYCDSLPSGLDYSVFDYGVNSGVGRPPKVLRRLLNMPAGEMGAEVVAEALKRDPAQLIKQLNDERLAFLRSLGTWGVFGRGWGARVASVRKASLAMANNTPPPKPHPPKSLPPPTHGPVIIGLGGTVAALLHDHLILLGFIAAAIVAGLFLLFRQQKPIPSAKAYEPGKGD